MGPLRCPIGCSLEIAMSLAIHSLAMNFQCVVFHCHCEEESLPLAGVDLEEHFDFLPTAVDH